MTFHNAANPPTAAASEAAEFEEILYHITHDLRASLRAIRMMPKWIADDVDASGIELPPSALESLEMMETQAGRMDQMLIDLRTYSRVGRKCDSPTKVSLLRELQRVVQALDMPNGTVVKHEFKVEEFKAPPNEIGLLLSVLLSNAIKHHPLQAPNVMFRSRQVDDMIEISAEDDGPGIEPKFHERVFQMLTTLQPRDVVEGSGLGLAIARKICRNFGGDMLVSNLPSGKGALFRALLPGSMLDTSPSMRNG